MKTKTLIYEVQVPEYWNINDIKGVPYDEEGNEILNETIDNDTEVYEYRGGVENMLNETLVFAEKKYNKRIDGEGHCWGEIFESKDFYIAQLNPADIAHAQTRLVYGGEDD